jgi:hypothetical protein
MNHILDGIPEAGQGRTRCARKSTSLYAAYTNAQGVEL